MPYDAALLSALIESREDLIWSVDLNYRFLLFNDAVRRDFQRQHGVQLAVGMTMADILPAGSAALWTSMYQRALAEGPFSVESPLLTGRSLELAFNPVFEGGRKTGVSVFCRNVSERKPAEELRYRALYDSMHEGVALHKLMCSEGVPQNYRLLDVNRRYEEITGIRREDAIGKLATDVYGTAEAPYLREYASVVQAGSPLQFETYFRPLDGHFVISVAPMGGDLFATIFFDITEQKQTEARYRLISENTADAIWLWDMANGRCVYSSPSVKKMRGYTSEEVMALSMEESMPADVYRVVAAETLRRVAAVESGDESARVRSDEIDFLCKDGTTVTTETVTTLQSDERGKVRYAIGVSRDITERKRMEGDLRKSEEKFSTAFLASPIATSIVDIANGGRIVDVNGAWEQTYGYQRQEAVGRTGVELGAIDCAAAEEIQRMFTSSGLLRDFEYGFRRKNGDKGTGMVSVARIEIGGKTYALATSLDITERKLAEQALRGSEEKFSKVFHSSPIAKGIINLEENGRIVDVNAAFERITGYRREEMIGRTEIDLWADPNQRQEAFRQLQANGSIANFENRFRRKNGDIGIGLISIDSIEIAGKHHAVVANIEITDRIRAEEEKAKLEDQLRQAQKLESVGRLAGGVAHDFNNLLTVINGYAYLLMEEMEPEDPRWFDVDEIRKAGERAAGLTKQLLAFSRKQIIEPKKLDLNATIRDSERMLNRLIGEDIAFTTRLDPRLGQVMADPEQIHQVIMNLAVNARDAMPDGGKLDVSTTNVQVGDADAATHPEAKPGPYVMITVTDTGSGMDEETRLRIFEPFFTTKSRDKGTGLGLSTVYGIVRQSGGWIDVASEPGVGTSFVLGFPRIDEEQVGETQEAIGSIAPHAVETILIVEDQDAVRRLTMGILKGPGYQLLEAADSIAAMGIAQNYSGEIHLLLTDVVLPGMNGKELSERLKALRPNMKVLFTSGYPADVIAHRGVLDPGVAYIPKPFIPGELLEKIRQVLGVGN